MTKEWVMILVDTNIFISSLFVVDKKTHAACIELFTQAKKGKVKLWTTEWVIAECVWFLQRQKLENEALKVIIRQIISTPGLVVQNKQTILTSLDAWTDRVGYIDAYNFVLMQTEGLNTLYSYDTGFDTIKKVRRIEP